MGAWGTGSFENDDARDFLAGLSSKTPEDLKQILVSANAADYLDASAASVAVVAGEVIAAARGSSSPGLPAEVVDWVDKIEGAPSPEMIGLASNAVNRVRRNSELKDLWLQADGLNEWSAILRDLEERLAP